MPLSASQRRKIETLIAARREALILEIRQGVARSRDDTFAALAGEVRDSADEATARLVADTDNAETNRDLRELHELDDAVARLADGTYGECTDCNEEIPFARLLAYPGAARCLSCQDRYERSHGHAAEPRL